MKSRSLALLVLLVSPIAHSIPIVGDTYNVTLTPTSINNCGPNAIFCGGMAGGNGSYTLGPLLGNGFFSVPTYLFMVNGTTFDSATDATNVSGMQFNGSTGIVFGRSSLANQQGASIDLFLFANGTYQRSNSFAIITRGSQSSSSTNPPPGPTPVPAPSTVMLLGIGLLSFAITRKRKATT